MRLKERFSKNLPLKILSVVFAVLLWVYVQSKEEMGVSFIVPLELQNLPSSLVITSEVIEHVIVEIRGKESLVSKLSPDQIFVHLDLSKSQKGENLFHLSEANVLVPENLKVTKISPVSLSIRFESSEKKLSSLLIFNTATPGSFSVSLMEWTLERQMGRI